MKTIELEVYSDGTKHWYKNGEYHREDGPAIECVNGTKVWYQNGQRRRKNKGELLNVK